MTELNKKRSGHVSPKRKSMHRSSNLARIKRNSQAGATDYYPWMIEKKHNELVLEQQS